MVENYTEKDEGKKYRMEVLFHARYTCRARSVCGYFHRNHQGKLGVCGHRGTFEYPIVYAHAGRDFLYLYPRKREVCVCEKAVYGNVGKAERERKRVAWVESDSRKSGL